MPTADPADEAPAMPFLFFAAIALIGATIHYRARQPAIHGNHAPDNTGLTLWADFIAPLVAIALYALWRRASQHRLID